MPQITRAIESYDRWVQDGPTERLLGVQLQSQSAVQYFGSILLSQTAVPVILPSSGSSNASGQITLTTALPYQPVGTVQIYLPSGVVTAGKQTGAGLYSVTFSSTTVCQLTDSTAVTANGAYTQTTAADLDLATVSVPGGAMGANGAVRYQATWGTPNNANNKIGKGKWAGVLTGGGSATITTSAGGSISAMVRNRSSLAIQQSGALAGSAATAPIYHAADTSVNQNITFTGLLAVATDYIILEGYTVEVLPAA